MKGRRFLILLFSVAVGFSCQFYPFFDDELPDYECPERCNGGCNETTCIIIGDGSNKPIVCPPGRLCRVDCIEVDTNDNTCKAEIDCSQASECVINCKEGGSCRGLITCGEGPCEVDCNGGACASGIDCSQSSSCRILCINSCEGSIVCGKGPCEVQCNGCDSDIDCTESSYCDVTCKNGCLGSIDCGSGPCSIDCSNGGLCPGPFYCADSCSCDVNCDDSFCETVTCPEGCDYRRGCTSYPDGCDNCQME